MRKSRLILIAGLFLLLHCETGKPKPTAAADFRGPNSSSPRFVVREGNQRVVVFVHGIFGDAFATWKNAGDKHFFNLAAEDTDTFGKTDIFIYGFPSEFWGGGFTVDQAAVNMEQRLRGAGVLNYEQIIFVCHSMGGLVVEQFLLTFPNYAPKVPLLFFFSTPQEGAAISSLADRLLRNPALKNMIPIDHNLYLTNMDNQWKQRQTDPGFPTIIRCAYETKDTYTVRIVPYSSATRFCVGASAPVFEDHINIVKPASHDADSYIALKNAVNLVPRPLPPPVELFETVVLIEPIADVAAPVVETMRVDDGSEDCSINTNRTARFQLREADRVT